MRDTFINRGAFVLAVVLAASGLAATRTIQTEVLVLASAATALPVNTFVDGTSGRKSIEIQNLGPNDMFCAFTSAGTVVNKARKVAASGGIWVVEGANEAVTIFCRAATADQLTGAATIVSEIIYRGDT